MALLKVFVKEGCTQCPSAKAAAEVIRSDGHEVQEFDLGTADGLAEGAYFGVMSTPTMLVVDDEEKPVAWWRGLAPAADEIRRAIMDPGRQTGRTVN